MFFWHERLGFSCAFPYHESAILIFMVYGKEQKILRRKNIPGVKTFRTLEELLADDNIELVVVNTPSVTHYDFTKQVLNCRQACNRRKTFYCNSSTGAELITLAKNKKLTLSVYHNRRYDSDYKTVKKILDEG